MTKPRDFTMTEHSDLSCSDVYYVDEDFAKNEQGDTLMATGDNEYTIVRRNGLIEKHADLNDAILAL